MGSGRTFIHLYKSYSAWTERDNYAFSASEAKRKATGTQELLIMQKLTVPILSKLANNSLSVTINSSAVHLDDSSVNPTISANKMLQFMKDWRFKIVISTLYCGILVTGCVQLVYGRLCKVLE